MLWSGLVLLILLAARYWGLAALSHWLSPALSGELGHVIMVAAVVAVTLFIDGLVRHYYWHRYLQRRRNRDTRALIKDILTIALMLLGLSIGLWWEEGFSFTGFITASGATAIILGIALQAVIQDLFSGLAINLDGSYALGDWLTIYSDQMDGPVYGRVTHMTWRSTFL